MNNIVLKQQVNTALGALSNALYPPRCVISGEIVDSQGMIHPAAWAVLGFIAPPLCRSCGMPFGFSPDAGTDLQCGPCLDDPPPFQSARAALVYDDASRGMILKFKHADHLQAVPALVPLLRRAGADMLADADVLVPVPLHRWRLMRRRYNQAALLAQGLARDTGVTCVPDALTRVRSTVSQGHMKAADRRANVRRAFAVHPRHTEMLRDKKIVIVDDVYTTGATVRECAETLIRAGAGSVHVLTVARVSRDG